MTIGWGKPINKLVNAVGVETKIEPEEAPPPDVLDPGLPESLQKLTPEAKASLQKVRYDRRSEELCYFGSLVTIHTATLFATRPPSFVWDVCSSLLPFGICELVDTSHVFVLSLHQLWLAELEGVSLVLLEPGGVRSKRQSSMPRPPKCGRRLHQSIIGCFVRAYDVRTASAVGIFSCIFPLAFHL